MVKYKSKYKFVMTSSLIQFKTTLFLPEDKSQFEDLLLNTCIDDTQSDYYIHTYTNA